MIRALPPSSLPPSTGRWPRMALEGAGAILDAAIIPDRGITRTLLAAAEELVKLCA